MVMNNCKWAYMDLCSGFDSSAHGSGGGSDGYNKKKRRADERRVKGLVYG